MNRIEQLFATKQSGILSIYLTGGYPKLESAPELVEAIAKAGVDLVEIGMPFSDPVADGPVIQDCHTQALENGMTLKLLLEQVKQIRANTEVPLVLMGYVNPVLQYGLEAFCHDAQKAGIDGLIIPDLPLEVYEAECAEIMAKADLCPIFLVTPQTDDERIRQLDAAGRGFLYAVSSASTTGANKRFKSDYLARLNAMALSNPTMVGFGIANRTDFLQATEHANGAIIGTAFLRAIADTDSPVAAATGFINEITGQTSTTTA